MKTYDFISFFIYISSIDLVNSVLSLETEGIFNGVETGDHRHMYQAPIFGLKNGHKTIELVGNGARIDEEYVLSAAHPFIAMNIFRRYVLKPMTFYVRLGNVNLDSEAGELVRVETIYALGYNGVSGQDDIVLLKLSFIVHMASHLWQPVPRADPSWTQMGNDGIVTSNGIYDTEHNSDCKLRSAPASIVDNSECDNMLDSNTSQICIKMEKDRFDRPRGLCKYDGGAPFIIGQHLVAIASKPKENCDDTERGSIYTDIRPFKDSINAVISGFGAPTLVFQNNQPKDGFVFMCCVTC